jgi:trimeric autotransporter adhesin
MIAMVRDAVCVTALAALLVGTGSASPPAGAHERVGVSGAVNPDATGIPPSAPPRRLVLGQEIVFNERVTTGSSGQTQILFIDQSTMSVGPSSDMVIDEFVYDPAAGTGKLAASLTRGVFRFVGGKLSKQDNAVTMQTPSATIGIRGGLILVNLTRGGQLDVIFGYGKGVTIVGTNGVSQTITRTGFHVTVSGPGASPSEPSPAPPGAIAGLLAQLDGRPGSSGGARTIPTDTMVANSGVATAISSNISAGIQAAKQTRPPSVTSTVQQAVPATSLQNVAVPQTTGQIIASTTIPVVTPPAVTPPVVTPPAVVVSYAGLFKSTNGNGTTRGFVDQSANARIPYTGGMLSNGVLSSMLGGAGQLTIPLVPGNSSFGPAGTASPLGQVSGTSYLSADGTFFYADLTPVNAPTQREFIFGGMPVDQGFYAPTGTVRLAAFTVQPDAALQSQIPFIPNSAGGNLANPAVSPYLVVAPANTAFGLFNVGSSPNAIGTRALQASLAINGRGINQSSVLVINTGSFFTSSDSGKVAGAGIIRGSFVADGTLRPVRISSGAATVPDGFNNNLFGGTTVSGFVLDQNTYNLNDSLQTQLASQVPLGGTAVNYAFTQPVIAAALPSNVGTSRTTQTLSGYFGGVMSPQVVGSGFPTPYAVTGTATIPTDATNNRLGATTFSGRDPFGTNTLTLNFGRSQAGTTRINSTFIDDGNFSAVEDQFKPSQVNGVNIQLNGDPTQASRIGLVTSNTVPSTSLLPAGVSYCQCQYLQWGYWTGELDTPDAAGTGVIRRDVAHINTWVAGIPTI